MALTLGLTGMDPATETALRAAFGVANQSLGARWSLVGEAEADHILVDMDSMYGPMSWLRLHAGGKHVIGLTSAPRTQTDFRLGRPFDAAQLTRLLADVAAREGVSLSAGVDAIATSTPAPVATAAPAPTPGALRSSEPEAIPDVAPPHAAATVDAEPSQPVASAPPVVEAGMASQAGAVASSSDVDDLAAAAETDAALSQASAPAPVSESEPARAPEPEPDPVPEPEPEPARDRSFADWLRPGVLAGRLRYRRESGPTLLLDADAQAWHGPTPLKPIAAYFDGVIDAADFEPVADAQWAAESAALGAAQQMSRLRWLGGLLAGRGALLPGHDPEGKYVLSRWPQTEREYPKHFRIATAMMKGPATLAEIAAASGIPEAEVADFVNANLETGFAEAAVDAPPPAPEPAKGGLLGRLRGR